MILEIDNSCRLDAGVKGGGGGGKGGRHLVYMLPREIFFLASLEIT